MIEKNIESFVMAKLRTALSEFGGKVCAVGSWQTSEIEGSAVVAIVTVTASPRLYETYSIPYCEIPISIETVARLERLDDDIGIADIVQPIADILEAWQYDIDNFVSDATLAGEFQAAGIRLDGGYGPVRNRDASEVMVTQNFTIHGFVDHSN